MSSAEATAQEAGTRDPASRGMAAREVPALRDDLGRGRSRLLRSELRLVLTRLRNVALLATLASGPVLIGVAGEASGSQPAQRRGAPLPPHPPHERPLPGLSPP